MAKTEPAPPLTIINALIAGFEAVAAQPLWALGPLALDLWLWLGPRLSIEPLTRELAAAFLEVLPAGGLNAEAIRSLQQTQAALLAYGERFNVFATLSTTPLGIPSLLASRGPTLSPLGAQWLWAISDPLAYVGLTVLLAGLGVWLAAAYWGGVASLVRAAPWTVGEWFLRLWGDWLQLLVFGVTLGLVLLGLGGPLLLIALVLVAWQPWAGMLLWLVGSSVLLWLVFYVSFTPHGLVVQRRNLFYALGDSLRLVQRNSSRVTGLWLVTLLLNMGLSWLWNVPADDSWLLLLGLVGHAVVTTALTAASFYLYQDCYRRWQEEKAEKPGTKGNLGK